MPRNIPNKSAYLYYTLFFWLWHRAILQSNHQCFYFSPLGSEQPDCSSFFFGRQPPVGQGLLIHEVSRSHTTTQHSRQDSSGQVISSSQRPLPDNTQHSQQHSCPRWDSKPQSQQASGRRPTPLTARPVWPAHFSSHCLHSLAENWLWSLIRGSKFLRNVDVPYASNTVSYPRRPHSKHVSL